MNILVIVESPTKVSTIKSYLGKGYKVVASYGHVRDLPKSKFGVDIENDFEPQYINIRGKGQIIDEIKKLAKESDAIYLAGDPDREGEAISWHLVNILGKHAVKEKPFPGIWRRLWVLSLRRRAVWHSMRSRKQP